MKNIKNSIITAFRFTLIILVLLFLLSAVGCKGNLNVSDQPEKESEPSFGTETTGLVQNTDAPKETTVIPETTNVPIETPQTSGVTDKPIETTADSPETTVPDETTKAPDENTKAPDENNNTPKCDHTHSEEFNNIVDDLLSNNVSNDEILQTKERLNSNRLVIAYGGLRLRDNPGVETGVPIGLIPDGEIIPVIDRRNGWVYTTYNGVNGWCSMEFLFDMFTYPSAGGAPIAQATVTNANGCKLTVYRHCAAKSVITTTIPVSTKVLIYMQDNNQYFVQYKDIWGYCSGADLLVEAFDPNTNVPAPPTQEFTKSDLIGSWTSVRRDNNELYTCTFTFNENGTFKCSGLVYFHANYSPYGNETGWYVAPMGNPSDYGTYGLDGDLLVMTYTGSDIGDYDEPHVSSLNISSLKNGKMVVNDSFELYIKNQSDMDILTLCDTVGVNRTAD